MKVSVSTIALSELDVDLLVVPATEEESGEGLESLVASFGDAVVRARTDFSGELGETMIVYPDKGTAKRLLVVGLGESMDLTAERLRQAAAVGAGIAIKTRCETVGIGVPELELDGDMASQALVEGFMLGSYRFTRYRTDVSEDDGPQRLVIQTEEQDKLVRRGADRGRIVSEAVFSARDLINTSPNDKTPVLLSRAIEKSGKKHGFEVSVWDRELIEEEGMGGLLAVNLGSQDPPTFNVLEFKPENARNERPLVLVGKGIVYDTGGLSLKPTKDSMDYMKSDMSGAAAVIGAFEAIAKMDLPIHVVGLIPATDNRPGERAYVPGDVIKMHSGATVEVMNTDAEGRMVLADALSYAANFSPDLVIDIATLTGSAAVAMGDQAAPILTTHNASATERIESMVRAGETSGDRVHPLPMFDAYKEQLRSEVADLKNVGGREGGCITAGKFLEHFVDYPWVHVDIAGVAFTHKARPYRPIGGTGFGVRLLVEFMRAYAESKR